MNLGDYVNVAEIGVKASAKTLGKKFKETERLEVIKSKMKKALENMVEEEKSHIENTSEKVSELITELDNADNNLSESFEGKAGDAARDWITLEKRNLRGILQYSNTAVDSCKVN